PHQAGRRVRLLRSDRRVGTERLRRGHVRADVGGRRRRGRRRRERRQLGRRRRRRRRRAGRSRRRVKTARPALTLVAAIAVGWVFAQTATTFTLKRDDTELVITNRALASEGARSIGNNRNCEEGVRLTVVYGPAPGRVETQVEDSLLTSHLAIIRTPEGAE